MFNCISIIFEAYLNGVFFFFFYCFIVTVLKWTAYLKYGNVCASFLIVSVSNYLTLFKALLMFPCSSVWSTSGSCQKAAWSTVLLAACSRTGRHGQNARTPVAAKVNVWAHKLNLNQRDWQQMNRLTTVHMCSASLFHPLRHLPGCWIVLEYI